MEFLVTNEVTLSPDYPADKKRQLIEAELTRGRQLQDDGLLKRIWRVPGRWAVVAVYEADDATQLHEALQSLPLWPWMQVTVQPLATHILEGQRDTSPGDLADAWR